MSHVHFLYIPAQSQFAIKEVEQNLGAITGQGGKAKLLVPQTSFSCQIWQGETIFGLTERRRTEN